jgi:hypothetical protein
MRERRHECAGAGQHGDLCQSWRLRMLQTAAARGRPVSRFDGRRSRQVVAAAASPQSGARTTSLRVGTDQARRMGRRRRR